MKRKLLIVIALVALVGTGAFAQLAIGVSAAAYSNAEKLSSDGIGQAWKDVRAGNGYLGLFAEIGMNHLAIGLSANVNTYSEDFGFGSFDMMNVDGNFYLQGHLFKYKAFLDPFLEVGVGAMSKNYKNSTDNPDTNNTPLYQSNYWDVGGGLGINLGGLGVFLKGLYNTPLKDPATGTYKDQYGVDQTYTLAAFPIANIRIIFGAKLIL